MEFLSYNFDGRGPPLTDDTELYMDDLMRSRNLSKGWDLFDGMGFIEPEMTRKSFVSTQYPENLVNDANGDSSKSATETNDEKLAQSDFKNKKILASRKSKDNRISVENSNSVPAKRARITNLQSQVPVCIVHGCNKDLSSSKEYHKRHKVCDVHSKTPVVIVNGIQQRFCQQCSRFHILAEFDEGKRSCRKRLMGHNERRRKPKWHNPFGSKLFGTDLSRTSSIFSKILPGGILDQQCSVPTNYFNQVKLEDNIPAPRIPKFLHDEMGKQYPSKNCLNSPLSVLELSAGSNPSCALSLLSAQSPSLLNNYAAISFQDFIQNPTRSTPENFILNTFSSSSGEVDQSVPDARACLGVGTPENEVSQETSGLKHSNPSREGAKTVDLVQLSLHLQKVEQQKYSAQY